MHVQMESEKKYLDNLTKMEWVVWTRIVKKRDGG